MLSTTSEVIIRFRWKGRTRFTDVVMITYHYYTCITWSIIYILGTKRD